MVCHRHRHVRMPQSKARKRREALILPTLHLQQNQKNKKATLRMAFLFDSLVGCEWLEHSTYGLRVRYENPSI